MKDKIIYVIKFLFVFTSTSFVSFSQTKVDTVYMITDADGEKETSKKKASYFRVRMMSDTSLKASDYDMDDTLILRSGYYKSFKPYIKQGHFIDYDSKGKIDSEGGYVENKKSGMWTYYYSTGERWYTQDYIDGNSNGFLKSYYKTGELKRVEKYKDDEFIEGNCYTLAGKDTAYYKMYIMPRFPGEDDAMVKYFQENLIYPKEARKKLQEGKVYVRYIISESGNIDTAFVFKSSGYHLLDNTAVQFIQNFPTFTPGYLDGVPYKVMMVQPVLFKLEH